jgi:hypothetical protein
VAGCGTKAHLQSGSLAEIAIEAQPFYVLICRCQFFDCRPRTIGAPIVYKNDLIRKAV